MKKETNTINKPHSIKKLFGEFMTQEELDAEYDVEKAVSNFGEYINVFQNDSQKIRMLLKDRKAFAYGPTLMETLTVYPSKKADAPVLLFIHGGYWRLGIGDDYDFVAVGPHEADFTVVIITYALAPHVNIPEMVRQVRSSIAWTARNISNYNGNAEKIFIAGHSAGAHLAAMAMTTDWSTYGLAADTIKGVLAISGLYELEPVSHTFVQPAIRITAEQILYASPIRLIQPSQIQLIVAWGEKETPAFIRQSEAYIRQWQNSGNEGNSLIVSKANHFNILNEFSSVEGIFTKAIVSLLKNVKSS